MEKDTDASEGGDEGTGGDNSPPVDPSSVETPPETKRPRGRPRLSDEERLKREIERSEQRKKRDEAVKEYLKTRVDISQPKPSADAVDPSKVVDKNGQTVSAPAKTKKRPKPPPDFVKLVENALAHSFNLGGKTVFRLATSGAEPPISFASEDGKLLAEAWAPIIARYLDIDGDFIMWFAALSSTGFVIEKASLEIVKARKTIPKK